MGAELEEAIKIYERVYEISLIATGYNVAPIAAQLKRAKDNLDRLRAVDEFRKRG